MDLQEITRVWVDSVKKYYENTNNFTQIHARGYFAGMSEREILQFVDFLDENNKKYPIHNIA